jgi:hypothetical protein
MILRQIPNFTKYLIYLHPTILTMSSICCLKERQRDSSACTKEIQQISQRIAEIMNIPRSWAENDKYKACTACLAYFGNKCDYPTHRE